MGPGVGSSRIIQFGPFELDLRSAELRQHNRKIRLQEQPFQILLMLLEEPGEVVLREDIRKRLWPNDTVVEFDHSINAAIKRLRDMLGDDAERPDYIETVARRGYRFIGEVNLPATESPEPPVEGPPRSPMEIAPLAKTVRLRVAIWIGAGLLVLGVIVGWLAFRTPGRQATDHVQISVEPADQLTQGLSSATVRPTLTAFALSPDGRLIVFSATQVNGSPQLFLRDLSQDSAAPLPGTEGARAPFFSPDGRWIGFVTRSAIKKIPVNGGPSITVYEVPRGRLVFGASWAGDGAIFFSVPDVGIFKIAATDITPVAVTRTNIEKGEQHVLPYPLRGGRDVMFTRVASLDWENAEVVVQTLTTGEQHVLLRGAADARYVATGHLVYMKTGRLMAVPFDARQLRTTGEPMPLIGNVMQAVNTTNTADETGAGEWAVSNSGMLAYVPGGIHPNPDYSLVWVDQKGHAEPVPSAPIGFYGSVRLSPSGEVLALNLRDTPMTNGVWTYDISRRTSTRLTFGTRNGFPIWSPDGKRLVFAAWQSGHANLYAINAAGAGKIDRLTSSKAHQVPSSWTQQGDLIAFTVNNQTEHQIWILPVNGDRKATLFFESPFELFWPEFSPDGHWIAYAARENGVAVVYVQPYPVTGEKRRISSEEGIDPAWAPNGREIFYRSRDGLKFYSVRITGLNPFRTEAPRLLFEGKDYLSSVPTRSWDISRDGQKFLLLRREDSKMKPVVHIELILSWTDELKRRVRSK